MRTTINVDDGVLSDLMKVTDAKTKTEAVNKAITEYVRLQRLKKLASLRGKLDLDPNSWKELRELSMRDAKKHLG